MTVDATHDPARRSWVGSANEPDSDFPIQNLPFGAFRRRGRAEPVRIGVAIGAQVLDLRHALDSVDWPHSVAALLAPLAEGDLNAFMALGSAARRELRAALSDALTEGSPLAGALAACLVSQSQAQMARPCRIGDYTDFYTGIHHATAVGKLFRPDMPLLPNYKWVPIGYHGRVSSINVSGQRFHRPHGQTRAAAAGASEAPSFGASRRVDHELELGVFIGRGNALGERLTLDEADDAWFGMVLLNDWSARDLQTWEYQPLGPFLSKNFATTVSPWIVTAEALALFRVPFTRPTGDPAPLPYLDSLQHRQSGALQVRLEAWLQTERMGTDGLPPHRLMQSDFAESAYWSVAQMIAHHASNGCNLQPGDLLGTGTQSGPEPGQGGSMLELSKGGTQAIALPGGEQRTFLEDGDTLSLRAFCERAGARRIGFGECAGTLLPAKD